MKWSDGRLTEESAETKPKHSNWAVFTTVGCQGGRPLLWVRHRARLTASVDRLGAGTGAVLPEEAELGGLLVANGFSGPARLRVVVWNVGTDRWHVEASAAESGAVGPEVEPARLTVERWDALPPLAGHKMMARFPWDLARERASAVGADDVLLVDSTGLILETSVTNVWVVRGRVVQTPPAPERCLPGVMRGWLLENLDVAGLRVRECDFDLGEVNDADEVWLSNAVVGLRRVGSTPDRRWESWPNFDRVATIGIPAPGWPSSANPAFK